MSAIDVRLDKPDRVYYPGEKVTGAVVITTESSTMSFNSCGSSCQLLSFSFFFKIKNNENASTMFLILHTRPPATTS